MRRTIVAASAAIVCSFVAAAAPAGAQYMNLEQDAPNWGLDAHEVRVVQFALRDADCYQGRIDGQVGPRTRAALRCALQKSNDQPDQLAQDLVLYEASFVATTDGRDTNVMTRDAAGDVELAPQRDTSAQMQQNMRQQNMQQQMRDSTMMPRDSMAMPMPRDTSMSPMPRDTTMMPTPRDSMPMPSPRDSMPMPTPRDSMPMPRDTMPMPMPRDSMPMPRDTTRTPPDTTRTPPDTTRVPPPR